MLKTILTVLTVLLLPLFSYAQTAPATKVSPSPGQTLSTPPLTVQCTNCASAAPGGDIAKQGARDATAQSWFVQDATGGLNLQSTQLTISADIALIKLKTDNLDVLLSTRATEATLAALNVKVTNLSTAPVGNESGTLVRQVGPITTSTGPASGQTQAAFSATTASQTLLASNALRSAVIVDCSSCLDDVFLNLVGATASSATGIRVYAGARFDTSGLGPLPTGIITVVSNTGTQTVKVIELSR